MTEPIAVSLDILIKCAKLYQDNIKYNEILHRLDDVQRTLEEKLDEQTIVRAKTGITHLIDAFNSENDEVRASELQMARSIFSDLININPTGATRGTTASYNNTYLICVGYYGNFHYFNYHRDYKNALSQIYKCVLKHPDEALLFFPSELFSKNYKELIDSAEKDFYFAMMKLKEVDETNFVKIMSHYFPANPISDLSFSEMLIHTGICTYLIYEKYWIKSNKFSKYLINTLTKRSICISTEDLNEMIKCAALNLENLHSDLKIECEKILKDLRVEVA